ncbi:MAG TPA: hypothetical protein VF725_11170, partial [Ktedonobacterales bacterium]
EAEETGWYRETLTARPELQPDIIALTRDHELLRLLLAEIQGILAARGADSGVVERFEAMLLLNSIHSREEERRLLGAEPASAEPDDAMGDAESAPAAWSDALTTPAPLAVARPTLYTQLVALLRERGLSPTDLQADLRPDAAGALILHVAYGSDYAQTAEWPLAADAPADNVDAILRQVTDACEQATRASYHARMHTPT